jgi:hypothetical protein
MSKKLPISNKHVLYSHVRTVGARARHVLDLKIKTVIAWQGSCGTWRDFDQNQQQIRLRKKNNAHYPSVGFPVGTPCSGRLFALPPDYPVAPGTTTKEIRRLNKTPLKIAGIGPGLLSR